MPTKRRFAAEVFLHGYDIEFLPDARVFHKMPNRQSGFSQSHVFYGLRKRFANGVALFFTAGVTTTFLLGRMVTGFILLATARARGTKKLLPRTS